MALTNSLIFFCYLLSLIICYLIIPSESIGFTLPLIPANFSLKSPSYHNHLGLRSPVHQEFAHYYVTKIRLGTPPIDQALLVDTGSDLLWVQCHPCQHCFDQGNIPFFYPSLSRSLSIVPCGQGCETTSPRFKCHNDVDCQYVVIYGDGHSISQGLVRNESLTFAGSSMQPVIVPDITFGCATENKGEFPFREHGISGIMGLNMGSVSFLSQLSDRIQGRFSHCLAHKEEDAEVTPVSMLKFGDDATLPPSRINDVKTIDILPGPYNRFLYYYVDLVGISVGSEKVTGIPSDAFKFRPNGNGGCIFDTGANFMVLEKHSYTAVMKEFDRQLTGLGLKRVIRFLAVLRFCYHADNPEPEKYPSMTLHFRTADYEVKQTYQYVHDKKYNHFCVALLPSTDGTTIIGARQQEDMQILYDLKNKKIQFMPDNCVAA